MEFQPVTRKAVSDTVYGQLVNEILSGRTPPGAAIPSERELALTFQVNRHAVREALKRVQQTGLVRIRHGGSTRVLDWRSNVGLEALSALVAAGVVPPEAILRDVAVMRRTIGADAARICAGSADTDQMSRVADAARDYQPTHEADVEFWTAIVAGSGNLAYRLALNTLVTAIDDIGAARVHELGAAEINDRDAHLALAEAILAHDGEAAHRLAHQMLSHIIAALDIAALETGEN